MPRKSKTKVNPAFAGTLRALFAMPDGFDVAAFFEKYACPALVDLGVAIGRAGEISAKTIFEFAPSFPVGSDEEGATLAFLLYAYLQERRESWGVDFADASDTSSGSSAPDTNAARTTRRRKGRLSAGESIKDQIVNACGGPRKAKGQLKKLLRQCGSITLLVGHFRDDTKHPIDVSYANLQYILKHMGLSPGRRKG
ncbi:MAG: hypothetical protein A2898_01430 [Candidatus Kerfeldbacteria bacterium RIFCSPLOWO2_01_FULL_48_11]|uniref:Uncharacterized protein n=1 Tax=Candidatus Kerfeldbacteria bacterium RIFCSPLOWO2_01_FULL_48_11 TaxID=1798543 RepID=A0A1G2B410_9BACT|nr:MAG: hypothetical protein UY34_C0010G0032 [Parcubacteria group bacterium GW2011_GWA2_48_9]KKW16282.1 MAG: hypothetical protein UY52_C0007G0042 [Parcubacteria group bacterium GW2011_GWC2_49_9]OGY83922.1 MAG: hypothetical protein A2898_01430 [Candidatus Kerfeldbacteria bacterium RIFCSPLOWO2_01_FULL_48_11]HCJ52569.1 hypothetical protein [Candidatus Kerfeldbacteria bacterium]HCM67932.1 hypothetical protein [Candidatus Kerfeldbacteria bacterium]